MVQVTELGYMGVGVKDSAAWKDFAATVVGFEVSDDGEADRCYLRMDYWHHRLVLHDDGSDDLGYLGFRVAGAEEFDQMQHQLTTAEIPYQLGSDDEAAERRVLAVLKLTDPGGNPIEIFHGPEVHFRRPLPSRPRHARPVQDRQRRARPLYYSPAGQRGGVSFFQGARHAGRRRVQDSDGRSGRDTDLHAL